jgi:hypothetical protein
LWFPRALQMRRELRAAEAREAEVEAAAKAPEGPGAKDNDDVQQ